MLKKTTIAVIGLAASGLAFAGSMGPVCTPGNVTVPCPAPAWDFGLQALYLKTINGAAVAYRATSNQPLTVGELNNDWGWGYRADGSYHFNTGNDVTVSWMHFSNDIQQTGFSSSFAALGVVTSPYTVIDQNRIDQVNLVMGQHVDVGLVKKMRFYGGLQYANIQSNATNYYAITLVVPGLTTTSANYYNNSDYKGVGPVIGIDYSYDLPGGHLSVIANGATSILYGTSRLSNGSVSLPTGLVLSSTYASKKTITPGFDGKLGLNYAYNIAQGVLNLQGGYQVTDYFGALQGQSLLSSTAPISAADFGLFGPYFGLKYVGNA